MLESTAQNKPHMKSDLASLQPSEGTASTVQRWNGHRHHTLVAGLGAVHKLTNSTFSVQKLWPLWRNSTLLAQIRSFQLCSFYCSNKDVALQMPQLIYTKMCNRVGTFQLSGLKHTPLTKVFFLKNFKISSPKISRYFF